MHATQPPRAGVDPTPADTLLRAADYLQRHGWTRGAYYATTNTDTPPACVTGALAIAAYGYPHPDPYSDAVHPDHPVADSWHAFVTAEYRLSHHLGLKPADRDSLEPETLYGWNDDPARTAAEVIATLRAAAQPSGGAT
jgi:hypothetical protein